MLAFNHMKIRLEVLSSLVSYIYVPFTGLVCIFNMPTMPTAAYQTITLIINRIRTPTCRDL